MPSSPALYSQSGRRGTKLTAFTRPLLWWLGYSSTRRRVGASQTATPPCALPAAIAASPDAASERHSRAEPSMPEGCSCSAGDPGLKGPG